MSKFPIVLVSVVIPHSGQRVALLVVMFGDDDWRAVAHAMVDREATHVDSVFDVRLGKCLPAGSCVDSVEVLGCERVVVALNAHAVTW